MSIKAAYKYKLSHNILEKQQSIFFTPVKVGVDRANYGEMSLDASDSLIFKTESYFAQSCLTEVFIATRHTPVTLGRMSLPCFLCRRCKNHICV